MVASTSITFRAGERLSHIEASRLADLAESCGARTVILDLSRCLEATTPALARFVLLRRELLARGRDFRLGGLCGQPAKLIEVHRLENVLPPLADDSHGSSTGPRSRRQVPHISSEYADNAAVLCLQ
jgi:hypothetical protein